MMWPDWQKPLRGTLPDRFHQWGRGLVFCAPFNELDGLWSADLSGLGCHLQGVLGVEGDIRWRGNDREFEGVHNLGTYMRSMSSLDLSACSEVTIVTEFVCTGAQDQNVGELVELTDSYLGSNAFVLRIVNASDFNLIWAISSNTTSCVWFTSGLQFGVRYHVVCTANRQTGSLSLYLNGALTGAQMVTNALGGTFDDDHLCVGCQGIIPSYPFTGLINHLCIYNWAMTASQAAQLYASRFGAFGSRSTAPLCGVVMSPYVRADVRGERLMESVGMQI